MEDCPWLPQLELCDNLAEYHEYEEHLYNNIFKVDFLDSQPIYKNAIVDIRRYPYDHGKEESFYHVTCKDYKNNTPRQPDLRRAERIRWIKAILENYLCSDTCDICAGILVWEEPYKGSTRTYFFMPDERFIVVIEKRKVYYILITAFYVEYDYKIDKYLSKYKKFKN